MKTKQIIYLVVAILIVAVGGYLVFTQLIPQSKSSSNTSLTNVEVVGEITSNIDTASLDNLTAKVTDYVKGADLTSGLGNRRLVSLRNP